MSILVNLGILGFFKYFNFFIETFIQLLQFFGLSFDVHTLNIILPVGISFYTFQTLAYTIDVYRRKITATDSWIVFFAYVAFFPQLVAGPIERAGRLLPQFNQIKRFDYPLAISGLQLILWGLFKKVVIADRLAFMVDLVYTDPGNFGGWILLLATLAFALQIYCDFSAYSDMAIGLGRLLGFRLMTNFRVPYFASSLRAFWHRWHISLSTWFRDYVYLSIGGNRVSRNRWLGNIMLTFLLSGLWHGANWTFLIWGGLHGTFYCIEAYFRRSSATEWMKIFWPGRIYTFLVVLFCWIFFRANSLSDALLILGNLSLQQGGALFFDGLFSVFSVCELGLWSLAFAFFILMESLQQKKEIDTLWASFPRSIRWMLYYFLILLIVLLQNSDKAPDFIYFQF